ANLLVDKFERICIGDFGLSSVTDKEILALTAFSTVASKGGTARWQAPELFKPDDRVAYNTKESDIYAWACVAYEIFAGEIPFANAASHKIVTKVLDGQRPSRPANASRSWGVWGLKETIWSLMEICWDTDPAKRPTMDMIIEQLETVESAQRSLSPGQLREIIRTGQEEIALSVDVLEQCLQIL
ncbi:hypothetical protein H0H92_007043, partial [Tricholoma furcatifolium]